MGDVCRVPVSEGGPTQLRQGVVQAVDVDLRATLASSAAVGLPPDADQAELAAEELCIVKLQSAAAGAGRAAPALQVCRVADLRPLDESQFSLVRSARCGPLRDRTSGGGSAPNGESRLPFFLNNLAGN